MFGLATLVGPLLGKLIAVLAVVAALVATYFGIKRSGAVAEKEKQNIAQAKERQIVQTKVDQARSQDQVIDQRVAEEVKKIEEAVPEKVEPPDPVKMKEGDIFKFCLLPFLGLFFIACANTVPIVPVAIEIPPAPILRVCLPPPHPEGVVAKINGVMMVAMEIPSAIELQSYLRDAPPCYQENVVVTQGYIEKLINRLKALGAK